MTIKKYLIKTLCCNFKFSNLCIPVSVLFEGLVRDWIALIYLTLAVVHKPVSIISTINNFINRTPMSINFGLHVSL